MSPKSGDLAVGNEDDTLTVWHVSASGITQYATLNASAGEPVALAYDDDGNLYAGDENTNAIDVFSARTIAAGGGNPTRTLRTSVLSSVAFVATAGHTLVAAGTGQGQLNLVVSVNRTTGADTLLQDAQGTASGVAFDGARNLIVNTGRDLQSFKKPWKGERTGKARLGGGFFGLSFDATRTQIWSTHTTYPYFEVEDTAVQSIGYPFGSSGGEIVGQQQVGCTHCSLYLAYEAVALYPQPKN